MNIGYVRVSTKEQNSERQIKMMKEKGIEDRFLFIEKQSGKDFNRAVYKSMILMLREGDVLYIENIDRLGRDFDGIISEWKKIRAMGVHIVALDNQELFNSMKFKEMGEIGQLLEAQMLSVFAYVAQQERTKMLRRQKEGIAEAKKKGIRFGRPKVINKDTIGRFKYYAELWSKNEITAVKAIEELECGKTTFYSFVKEYGYKKDA